MRPRFWQSITAGLAVACLTFTAAAQLGTGGEQDQQNQRAQQDRSQQRQSADQRQGAESSQQLRIGTVDLKAVSEAYKQSEQQSQARGQGQQQGQEQEGSDLQAPAQADRASRLGQQGEDSGIDEQMLSQIREQARSVAQEEDVDLIVLEVLHENGSDVETIDLTDQVIERIEQGDDQQQTDPLMGGQNSQQDSEQSDSEGESDGGLTW